MGLTSSLLVAIKGIFWFVTDIIIIRDNRDRAIVSFIFFTIELNTQAWVKYIEYLYLVIFKYFFSVFVFVFVFEY